MHNLNDHPQVDTSDQFGDIHPYQGALARITRNSQPQYKPTNVDTSNIINYNNKKIRTTATIWNLPYAQDSHTHKTTKSKTQNPHNNNHPFIDMLVQWRDIHANPSPPTNITQYLPIPMKQLPIQYHNNQKKHTTYSIQIWKYVWT